MATLDLPQKLWAKPKLDNTGTINCAVSVRTAGCFDVDELIDAVIKKCRLPHGPMRENCQRDCYMVLVLHVQTLRS